MADTKASALTPLGALTADDLLYVVNDPAGTPASNVATAAVLRDFTNMAQATGTDADTTMAINTLYVVDMSAWATADRTYTLPATAAVGDRIGVMVTAGDASHELILTAGSGDTLNGISGGTEWSRVFITNEVVIMRCIVANTTWMVEHDGRIPCKVILRLTTNTNTTESAATLVIPTDRGGVYTADVDVGGCADASTSKFNFRRAGTVAIFGRALTQVNVTSGSYFTALVWNGTTTYAIQQIAQGGTAQPQYSYAGAAFQAAGNYLQFRYRSQEGSKGLATDSTFCVMEQL